MALLVRCHRCHYPKRIDDGQNPTRCANALCGVGMFVLQNGTHTGYTVEVTGITFDLGGDSHTVKSIWMWTDAGVRMMSSEVRA